MIKTTLRIDGMMCNMCEAHVNEAVNRNFDVKKVTSSHDSGTTEIISESPLDEEKLRSAIESTGYKVLSAESAPYEKKRFSLFGKK